MSEEIERLRAELKCATAQSSAAGEITVPPAALEPMESLLSPVAPVWPVAPVETCPGAKLRAFVNHLRSKRGAPDA